MFRRAHTLALLCALSVIGNATVAAARPDKAPRNNPPKEWYVKTIVSVQQPGVGSWRDDTAGVFGQLRESSDGYDRHDIPVFQTTVNRNAALVFYHGEPWQERAGEYLSDYRSVTGGHKQWLMLVNSIQAGATVTVSWDGLYELTPVEQGGSTRYRKIRNVDSKTLRKLKLLDPTDGSVTPAVNEHGELQSYRFIMDDSGSRQLRWVLGPLESRHYTARRGATDYVKQQKRSSQSHRRNKHTDAFGDPPHRSGH